jgi:hypothetical protein
VLYGILKEPTELISLLLEIFSQTRSQHQDSRLQECSLDQISNVLGAQGKIFQTLGLTSQTSVAELLLPGGQDPSRQDTWPAALSTYRYPALAARVGGFQRYAGG